MIRRAPTRSRTPRLLVAGLVCAAWAGPAWPADGEGESQRIVALREEAARYEFGRGVGVDGARAVALYCQAARLGDADSQFELGWIYANGRNVERDDARAAFFFQLAAEQGIAQAERMLKVVGEPTRDVPECMRPPAAPPPDAPLDAPLAGAAIAEPRRAPPPDIARLVARLAPQYRVQPQLALAIIEAESNFDATAVSPKNAMGLMQLIPETAARFKVRNPYDPAQNIRGGMAYLRWLLAYFEGDVTLVAAAYNAGERAVERYRGVPPYAETRSYVRRIVRAVGALAHPFDANVTAPSPQLAANRTHRGERSP